MDFEERGFAHHLWISMASRNPIELSFEGWFDILDVRGLQIQWRLFQGVFMA